MNGTKICFWCCPIPISMQAPRHWIEPGMLNSSGVKMHINSIAWCRNKANCWKTIARKKKKKKGHLQSYPLVLRWKGRKLKVWWRKVPLDSGYPGVKSKIFQLRGCSAQRNMTLYGLMGGNKQFIMAIMGGGRVKCVNIQEHCSSGFQRQGWKSHAFKCNLSTNN